MRGDHNYTVVALAVRSFVPPRQRLPCQSGGKRGLECALEEGCRKSVLGVFVG